MRQKAEGRKQRQRVLLTEESAAQAGRGGALHTAAPQPLLGAR